MIKSFADKNTEKIFNQQYVKGISKHIQILAFKKLLLLDKAETVNELRFPPGNHLELLAGDRKRQYSIRINSQYRICFNYCGKNSYNVEIIDYH